MIKKNITNNGYHIFLNNCNNQNIEGLIDDLSKLSFRRTPLNEKNQTVWWDEIDISSSTKLSNAILDKRVKKQIETEFSEIKRVFFWANRYRENEYIPKHCDTDGDLQIILPIFLPPKDCGGELLFHHNGKINLVPQRIGCRILFDATKTPHEITKLKRSSKCDEPLRIICVGRLFFQSN